MLRIERLRSLDDRRCGLVTTLSPGHRIERRVIPTLDAGEDDRLKILPIGADWTDYTVGVTMIAVRTIGSPGGNKYRHNRPVVAVFVEVLEVERVAEGLVDRCCRELALADLVLEDEDQPATYDNRVGSATHARDRELEKDVRPRKLGQQVLQMGNYP